MQQSSTPAFLSISLPLIPYSCTELAGDYYCIGAFQTQDAETGATRFVYERPRIRPVSYNSVQSPRMKAAWQVLSVLISRSERAEESEALTKMLFACVMLVSEYKLIDCHVSVSV